MILNCTICGNEVERGGYSSEVAGVLLRPLCEPCDRLCSSNPNSIAENHPWLFDPTIRRPTPPVTSVGSQSGAATAPQLINSSPQERELLTRYKDAYLVARATVGFGGLIKGIGVALATLIMLIMIIVSTQTSGDIAFIPLLVGVGVASFGGVLIYLLGVLVSAQGQILKASLDSAVNTSPFLSDANRANIMSLPSPSRN
jgi:hypothetical protein